MEKIGILVELDGAAKFKSNLNEINKGIRSLTNESKMLTSEFASFSSSSARTEAIQRNLAAVAAQYAMQLKNLTSHYKELENAGGKSAGTMAYWRGEIAKVEKALDEANAAVKEFNWAISSNRQDVLTYEAELDALNASYDSNTSATEKAYQNQSKIKEAITAQEQVVAGLSAKYQDYKARLGENAEATMRVREEYARAKQKLSELNKEFANNSAIIFWGQKLEQSITNGRQKIATLEAELGTMRAALSDTATEEEKASVNTGKLTQIIETQKKVVQELEERYRQLTAQFGLNSTQALKGKENLERAKTALIEYENALKDNSPFAVHQRNLEKEIKMNEQAVKTYQTMLNRLNSEYSKNDTVVSRSAQAQMVLRDAMKAQENVITSLEEKYTIASKKYGENSEEALKLKASIEQAKIELKGLNDEFNRNSVISLYGQRLQEVGTRLATVGNAMQTVGRSMTMYLTTPLLAVGAFAVKSASDFEAAFANVEKVLDATAGELASVKQGIMDMSTETASTKEEIAETLATVGRLGVEVGKGGENILKFTKTMIELGDTTDLSAEEAANALGKFVNITRMSQGDIDKLGSAVVYLGNHFAASESEIIPMMQKMAAAGTIAGFTSQEIAGISTALAATSIKAEAGGTSMTKVFQTLNAAVSAYAEGTTEKVDLIASMAGVSAEEFANAWKDKPIEGLKMFLRGLSTVTDDSVKLDEVLSTLGIKQIRQSVAVKNLALSYEDLDEAIDVAGQAFDENTALTTAASKRYRTFEARLSQVKETAKNTASAFGEEMMPMLEKVMNFASRTVEAWGRMSESEKEARIRTLALVAAIGPVTTGLGKLVTGIGNVHKGFGKLFEYIGSTGAFAETAFSLGTLVPVIGGITAAVTLGIGAWESYKDSATGYANIMSKEQQEVRDELDASSARIDAILPRLDALQQKDSLSADEKQRLANMVNYLNSEFDDLNIEIDEGTGKIIDYDSAVRDNIVTLKEHYKAVAAQKELQGIWDKTIELEAENIETTNKLVDVAEDLADVIGVESSAFFAVGDSADEFKEKLIKLADKYPSLSDAIYDTIGRVEDMSGAIDKNNAKIQANEAEEGKWNAYLESVTNATEDLTEAKEDEAEAAAVEGEALDEESDILAEQSEAYGKLVEKILETTESKRAGFALFEQEKVGYGDITKALQSQIDTYSNYTANLATVQEYVNGLSGAEQAGAQALLDYTAAMGIDGAQYLATFADGIRNGNDQMLEASRMYAEANLAADGYNSAMIELQAGAEGMSGAIETSSQAIVSGMETASQTTAEQTANAAESAEENFGKIPEDSDTAMDQLNLSLTNGMQRAQTTARTGANNIYNALNSKTSQYYSIGLNIGQGLANGLSNKAGELYRIAYNIGLETARQVQAGAQVHSPSRITTWVGEEIDNGLILGMENRMAAVGVTARALATRAVGTISSSLFGLGNGARTLTTTGRGFDGSAIASAVREGASEATINVYLDDREVSRSLRGMGVAFA